MKKNDIWTKLKKSLIPEKIFEDITLNKIGAIITNQEVIANRFDDFFINVAANLLKKLGETNYYIQE